MRHILTFVHMWIENKTKQLVCYLMEKMPLIWDDYQYSFVDDEDEYDKSCFVVSRKLFISLIKDNSASPVIVKNIIAY